MTFDFVGARARASTRPTARARRSRCGRRPSPTSTARLMDTLRAHGHRDPHLDDAGRGARADPLRAGHDAPLLRSRRGAQRFYDVAARDEAGVRRLPRRVHRQVQPGAFLLGRASISRSRGSPAGRAPERPGADAITRESYSHEVISHGWWPGGGAGERAGVLRLRGARARRPEDGAASQPAAAFYSTDMSEFVLPYEAVRHLGDSGGRPARVPRIDLRRRRDAGASGIAPAWRGSDDDRRPAPHIAAIETVKPPRRTRVRDVREDRRATGCTCAPARRAASTLCCDSSPNRHASKHAQRDRPPGHRLGRARRALALLLPRRRVRRVPKGPPPERASNT